ncbi:MAG: LPS biosynthesis protein WbpP [Elusimicrobia bacterium]|nr:MAG: LPS biosynthesis protein WbpP [Elusimicrobiota bacterium]
MEKPIWLVTGGAGFIGSNIVEALLKKGEKVRVLDNFSTGKKQHLAPFKNKITLVKGDICRPADCRKAVKGVTYVLHQAAIRSVPKSMDRPTASHDANATGTLNMLLAARDAKVKRFVYASSSSAYGDQKKFPQKTKYKPQPISPYAVQKLTGEHYAIMFSKAMGLETVSLRYFNVFGPRQDPESKYSAVIPSFMEAAYLGKPLDMHWDGKQSRDFTHVFDVVQANLKAAKTRQGVGETYNVANGKSHSMLDLQHVIEKIIGRQLERKHFPRRQGDVRKTWADIGPTKKKLGYNPKVSFEKGLRITWDYFESTYFRKLK